MADGFRIASAFVQVSPDLTGFREELQEKVDEATEGVEASVRVGLDTTDLDAKADDVKAKVDELNEQEATPRVGLDDADLDAKADDAKAKLDDLDAKEAKPTLELEAADFDGKSDDATEKLARLGSDEARPRLDLDDSEFDAKVDESEAKLEALKEQSATVNLGAGGGESGGGEGGGLLGGLALGASALLPGIGGAATGLGLLGATGALAFGGIAKSLSAAHEASQNVGMTSQQTASTQFSNAVAVQQAQLSVGQAHEQAAQDATQSAQQIESSQMNLASVERNAAASQVQALQSVEQAQQGVEQANYGLSEAQYNLSQAWITAREDLQNLNDQLADSKLSVQSAQLAISQAIYNQTLVDQNAYSTSLDRAQAALAVTQSQQQLTDAQAAQTDAQTAANTANSQGVAGSQTVVQATQAVTQAKYAQANAVQQQQDASANLTLTEQNNAAQITQAQMQVSQAQEQAAYQQQQDTQNVANAEKNLTDTVKEQQLQWAATMSTQNQAANQFAKDMAALTPAGRGFVDQILGMKGAYKGLEAEAQNAVLPGFTIWLHGIADLAPTVEAGVGKMGTAMGNAFGQFGKQMQTPAFAKVLTGLINNGVQFANIVLPAFAQFIQELAKIGSQNGAVSGLAGLLAGIAHGLTGLASSIGHWMPSINAFLKAAGAIIAQIGPALGNIVGLVAGALRPLSDYLNRHPNGTIVKVLGDILGGLLAFKGLQKLVSGPIEAIPKAFATLKGLPGDAQKIAGKVGSAFSGVFGDGGLIDRMGIGIAGFATKVGGWMSSAASSVVSFVSTLGTKLAEAAAATWAWIAKNAAAAGAYIAENIAEMASATAAFIAENAATLGIGAALTVLVGGIVYLATHWKQSLTDIKNWAEDAWHFIYDGFGKYLLVFLGPAGLIALGVIELAQHWNTVWGAIKSTFNAVTGAIRTGAEDFVSGIGSVWDRLESIFKTPVNFLIKTVYDDGIARLWNDVVGAVGLGSIRLPIIPALAAGGVVPGWSPGKDNHIAAVSGGEGILTPQATRAVGGKGTIDALNKQYPSSGSTPSSGHAITKMGGKELRRHLTERPAEHILSGGMFSSGGVAGDIGGFFSSAVSDVTSAIGGAIDVAKMVAAVATGNTTAFTNAAAKMIGTGAAGDLAKIMVGIPKTLVTDLADKLTGSVGGAASGSSSAVGSLPQNWRTIATFLAGHGFTKYAAAGVAGNIDAESGGQPEILEQGGGGGGGLIQWTPYPAGYITGNAGADLMTQLNAILSWGGGPSVVNKGTSPSNAAQIYQDYYEKPANLTASLPQRMASANAVYKAMGWGSFDQGGQLPPGMTMAVNSTGKPEAVLTSQQWLTLAALADHLTGSGQIGAPGSPAAAGRPVSVSQYFTGSTLPTPEQKALMARELALAIGGAAP